jgi:PadR family transcriptional regulator PadR
VQIQIKRGSAEIAILAVLAERPLHGYEIGKTIERETDGALSFNLASLYPMLYRLEKRGWVKGTCQTKSTGRRRRYYRLTAAGEKQLAALGKQWRVFFEALNRLVGVARA